MRVYLVYSSDGYHPYVEFVCADKELAIHLAAHGTENGDILQSHWWVTEWVSNANPPQTATIWKSWDD